MLMVSETFSCRHHRPPDEPGMPCLHSLTYLTALSKIPVLISHMIVNRIHRHR